MEPLSVGKKWAVDIKDLVLMNNMENFGKSNELLISVHVLLPIWPKLF